MQLIDAYVVERLLDVQSFSKYGPIQKFLAGDPTFRAEALDGLATALHRDDNYDTWSLSIHTIICFCTIPLFLRHEGNIWFRRNPTSSSPIDKSSSRF